MDYHPKLYCSLQRATRLPTPVEGEMWKLSFHRRQEVRKLLMELPLGHREKVTKAKLALSFITSDSILDTDGVPEGWGDYVRGIEQERLTFVGELLRSLSVDSPKLPSE